MTKFDAKTFCRDEPLQLDLFCDNRRTIRLNDAENLLQNHYLDEALGVYAEPLLDTPDDTEYLRTRFRDDQNLLQVRRRMRKQSPFMFAQYMEKIRRTLG